MIRKRQRPSGEPVKPSASAAREVCETLNGSCSCRVGACQSWLGLLHFYRNDVEKIVEAERSRMARAAGKAPR